MPKIVEVPELGEIEFPDDISDEDISGIIDGELSKRAPLEAPDRPASVQATAAGAEEVAAAEQVRNPLELPEGVELNEMTRNPLEDPRPGPIVGAVGKTFAGLAGAASGALDYVSGLTETPGEKAGVPENQGKLDAVNQQILELKSQMPAMKTQEEVAQHSTKLEALIQEATDLSRAPRESTLAGKLARTAANATAEAERVPGAAGSISRAVGTVGAFGPALALGPGGLAGLAVAGGQASAEASSATRTAVADDLRKQGFTNETQIDIAAQAAGNIAAAKAALTLPIYLLTGRLAAAGAGKVLPKVIPNATRLQKVGAQMLAATGANVGTGSLIRSLEGEEGAPNLEQFTMDALWGVVHGVGVNASERAKARARGELASRGWAQHEIDNPSGIPERFQEGKKTPVSEAAITPEILKANETQPPKETPTATRDTPALVAETRPPVEGETVAGIEPVAPQLRGAIDPAPVKTFVEEATTPAEAQRRAALAKDLDSPLFRTEPLPDVVPPPGPNALRPLDKSQAGGLFGSGGTRTPKPVPIGGPPSGNRHWLKIEPWYRRPGFEREGASLVLQTRQDNPLGKRLGRATDQQFDVEANLQGKYGHRMDQSLPKNNKVQDAAFDEWSRYIREKENGRPVPVLSSEAQKLNDAFGDIAEHSGLLFNARGGKVSSPNGYRPMHLMGRDFIPRAFDPAFMKVIRNPEKNVTAFNNYVNELAAHKAIPVADAAAFLNDMAGGKSSVSSKDFMGNIELARGARLPESFYDYDMKRVVSNYINGYAARMGQIIAYGQRLEGGGRVIQKNLWDLAKDEVRGGDKATANWLAEAERQSNNELSQSAIAVAGRRLQALATGLLLSNPTSTVPRNLLSGLVSTAELLGTRRTIRAANSAIISAHGKLGAKESGVLREDMAALLHAEQVTGDSMIDNATRWLSKTMLRISGYDASERFVRTTNFLAGSSFARDFAAVAKSNPNGRMARQMAALIERVGVDPNDIIKENGDWKTGDQTRRFLRTVVTRQQGGYKFNQVPLWGGTAQGRFFYQFGRWGTQKIQNVVKNVLKPAFLGTETTINGVKMAVRDFKPLVRFAAGMVLAGEAFALVAQGIFGRDRKDDSLTEIMSAFGRGDMKEGFKMLGGRALNDIIMSGSLGIWGGPVEAGVSIKDQSRLKNPAEPPGGAGIRAAVDLVISGVQQHTLTGDDTKQFLQSFVPGIVGVTDATRNLSEHLPDSAVTKKLRDWIEAPKYEAENDQRTLRNATERWAKSIGKDSQGGGGGKKTPNTPVYRGIRDALLIGDVAKAKQLRATFLRQFSGSKRQQAERNLSESIRGQQPFRSGNYTSEENQKNFYRWAKRNLSQSDLEQVVRVQARYERAAKAAGMWKQDDD